MNKREVEKFLKDKPGYYKTSLKVLSEITGAGIEDCREVVNRIRRGRNKKLNKLSTSNEVFVDAFKKKEIKTSSNIELRKSKEGKNVLVIGDLHEPFCLEGYLEHCMEVQELYDCDEVVFIGDVIDLHASSFHSTDPDGHSAGEELRLAIENIRKWYSAFPKATVIIGNHDRIVMRKAYASGLSKLWIKEFSEVLGTPGWTFQEALEIDDVLYIHGEGGTARSRARRDLQSVVQGHLHSQAYVDWIVGTNMKIFGMQVGCGVDNTSYAMAYGKQFAKPALGCGVVLKGRVAINCMM